MVAKSLKFPVWMAWESPKATERWERAEPQLEQKTRVTDVG